MVHRTSKELLIFIPCTYRSCIIFNIFLMWLELIFSILILRYNFICFLPVISFGLKRWAKNFQTLGLKFLSTSFLTLHCKFARCLDATCELLRSVSIILMEPRISVAAHMHMPLTVATTAAEFGGADPAASIVNRHQSLAGKTMLHVQRSPPTFLPFGGFARPLWDFSATICCRHLLVVCICI